ncbi:AAA family ATPase [Aeromonas media]|uniref:AAA family ATPase n=1 Tax=Aeromonas media TaxID=651 RepID=UPI003D1AFE7E
MGAGENALFETFSVMYSVAEGALVVIDEVELGLHAEAQKKFMQSLKQVCKERRIQIIFTTHSKEIFSSLPDDARVFIDSVNGVSSILNGISPEFAFSKLSAESSNELSLLVEDEIAKSIIQAVIPKSLRTRLSVEVIGSASALSRQLSANYNRGKKENIIVLYDADQKVKEKHNLTHAYEMTESSNDKEEVKEWLRSRMLYLPGNTWPERWLIDKLMEKIDVAACLFNVEIDEFADVIRTARGSEKHKEIYVMANLIGLDEAYVLNAISGFICTGFKSEFDGIIVSLNEAL